MDSCLPMLDGEPFIRKMEEAQVAGDLDFVGPNMPRLDALIAKLDARQYELAQLNYRARMVRMKHEPGAMSR